MQDLIRKLEQISFKALPALTTRYYHGWLLRFANGYTRRANSVNPLYGMSDDVERQITFAENAYKHVDLTPVFKLTDAALPGDLDDRLDHSGYVKSDAVAIMTHTLDAAPGADPDVQFQHRLTPTWCDPFFELAEIAPGYKKTITKMFEATGATSAYALLCQDKRAVACGRAVLDGDWVGVYSIATAPDVRRQGYGTRITNALLGWAYGQGATNVYLQVHSHNEPALQLYDKLGFSTTYHYWYRSLQ